MTHASRATRIALAATAIALSGLAPYLTITAQAPAARAAAATAANAPAAAQGAAFDVAARRAVIDTVVALLDRHYVDADTGKLIGRVLADQAKSGAYDQVTDPFRFAEVLTNDLRAVNGDKHLLVQYDPSHTAMRPGPEGLRMMEPPGEQRARREVPPDMAAAMRRGHFALGRVDVLPGNIGYLELRGFSGMKEAEDAIVDALRYVQYSDAMIFDLRRNGGGSAELVNFLISHFTGPDTLASLTVTNRSGGEKFTRYTLASVPGPRRTDVPVYVLTSGYTASAGEDFSFVLKNLGRATIVGQPTAGAGHNNAFLDAGHGFGISISFTRVSDPKTGAEWERIGVQPDVVVDQADALLTAQSLAVKKIASAVTGDAERKESLAALGESLEAQLHPHAVSAKLLASYAGEYAGGRKVAVAGDKLTYTSRAGAPADTLVALSDSAFAIGERRVAFEKTAKGALQMRLSAAGRGTLTYARVAK
jgi:retinol-binding protein 3